MFVTFECWDVYYMSPTKSQMRTSSGPLVIVIKPKAKEKIHHPRCYFWFTKRKKVHNNCIFYQRLLPHTFPGPTIRYVPAAPGSQVRMSAMLIFVWPPAANGSKFSKNWSAGTKAEVGTHNHTDLIGLLFSCVLEEKWNKNTKNIPICNGAQYFQSPPSKD